MDPRDPSCPCERCGHLRRQHYFENLLEGAAFQCCWCRGFVEPGKLAEVERAEQKEFEDHVLSLLDMAREAMVAWYKRVAQRRRDVR